MRLVPSILTLMLLASLAGGARADEQSGLVFVSQDSQAGQDDTAIELTDFSGGVGAADAKDGGNSVIIQMLQPGTTATAPATVTPGPYGRVTPIVSRP